ncbi:tRNA dimethylallyltransferase 2 isoform X2 [Andrographis paniculata]|uniref:tRNA dimethylallyltransferase 2 isoform X2 n=1 Tax=Andrographis paniculata TaxID=175694 RepID=UPI0021E93047|nr:tRNA dimethylallyltransferase 2 isoform X2 [Andrographis paniculata]
MEAGSTPVDLLAGASLNPKPKIVVILGASGSGKSKLAIDLGFHFPIEIINADSMQVYRGLDVLTNKVPVHEQKGIPHHLLGTISPNVEFTAKDFRDSAMQLIDEIWSRNCLPVIVGGTNYYIQALVSRFLLDEHADYLPGDNEKDDSELGPTSTNCDYSYSRLKDIDPVAADRIHPNDQRKIKQYLSLYSQFSVLPSKFFQGNTMQNWGRAVNLKYDCCFICVDASLPALDQYVNHRVDCMVSSGLLSEVRDIYISNADYTRGLRQAIGVREFEDFLRYWNSEHESSFACPELFQENMRLILDSVGNDRPKFKLEEAIEKVKLNTRRLVRRQRRRLSRLEELFGWNIHFIDVTECLQCASDSLWTANVVEPSVSIIKSFMDETGTSESAIGGCKEIKLAQKDLWTRYVCQACGNKELRGEHEWEQHKQGRSHRKRASKIKRSCLLHMVRAG